MSQHLSDKKDVDDYFNKKLYIDLGNYKINQEDSFDDSDLKSSFDLTSNVNNGKFTLQNCLSKDLLETLDCFSPINEFKKEEIKPDSFNLDETNDNSILFHSSRKSNSIDEDLIQNSYAQDKIIKDIIPLIDNNYSFIPKNFNLKKNKVKRITKERPGDWICFFCHNLNFSFRIKCNRCGISKEISEIEKFKNIG